MRFPDPNDPGLAFAEALDFFKNKVRIPTAHWSDIWKGAHARAFVVAGAMRDDLLKDLQEAIEKAIREGTTLEEFRKDFDQIVKRRGWSYNGRRNWRTAVIYNTNLRQAHMAGRWAQFQRNKQRRPYLLYVALKGGDRRPEHQALDGLIRPVDDPIWKVIMPINGWGCKCTVRSLSDRDLKRFGYEVTPESPELVYELKRINTPHGPVTVRTPKGIDPGFAYNVGEAAWGNQISDQALRAFKDSGEKSWQRLTQGNWQSRGRPETIPIDPARATIGKVTETQDELQAALEGVLKGPEKAFSLPDGSPVLINAAALAAHLPADRGAFVPFLPELLEDPFEIWISFERHQPTGRVALRKRLVKMIDTGRKKGRGLLMVANVTRGLFEGWTFLPIRKAADLNNRRAGWLVYGRDTKGPEKKGPEKKGS